MSNPHDRFFKQIVSRPEAARSLVLDYLPPDVVALLDESSLVLRKDTFVDAELQEHFSDLLYQVDLKGGRGAYVYVLFEHKSYVEPLVAFQLLRYLVRIWEQSLREGRKYRLAPVIPVVVYHGAAIWRVGLDFADLFEGPEELLTYWPKFSYDLCDLSTYSDDDIRGEITLRVGLLLLKHIFRDDLEERLPDILMLLRELSEQATGLEYLKTILRYVARGTDKVTREGLHRAVEAALAEEGSVAMNTLAERWTQEGLQQGIQQGMQQGMQKGLRQGLQRGKREGLLSGIELGLELKFGDAGLLLLPEIYKIEDVDVLRAVHEGIRQVEALESLRGIYAPWLNKPKDQSVN
ncbi:MAG: Rpn family recombination-promoting nuclease/putative transposase [Chloroflexota bacterium]|nr:Rpn family recombination-promoting nuclease/putative transposase [Chloroflexota bacterium]